MIRYSISLGIVLHEYGVKAEVDSSTPSCASCGYSVPVELVTLVSSTLTRDGMLTVFQRVHVIYSFFSETAISICSLENSLNQGYPGSLINRRGQECTDDMGKR